VILCDENIYAIIPIILLNVAVSFFVVGYTVSVMAAFCNTSVCEQWITSFGRHDNSQAAAAAAKHAWITR